jgi:hypothetical protein
MRKLSIIIILIAAFWSSLPAQGLVSVSGLVEDAASGSPVPFVNVVVKGTVEGTSASATGFFSIVTRAADTIIFSAVGYRPYTLPVPDTLPLSMGRSGKDGTRHPAIARNCGISVALTAQIQRSLFGPGY